MSTWSPTTTRRISPPRSRPGWRARPRYHLHFTSTYSFWLNQVERWLELLSEQTIEHGYFQSERSLIHRIHAFKREYNKNATPFVWVATARSILRKIEKLCAQSSDSIH